jgi:hypothetical protein
MLSRNVKIRIYKTRILPVVLYRCETLSLTLREEHGRRVFENRVLRWIFGPKKDEVMGEWRKLHNEELCDSLPSVIRILKSKRMRDGACSTNGGEEESVQAIGGKARGKETIRKTKIILRSILEL